MSAGHTPGPWFGDGEPFDGGILIYKQDGPVDVGMAYTADDREIDETRANARLIAAAPDLLSSLIELLEPLERASAEMVAQGKAINEAGEAAFDRARAAISRATGEQP